MSGTHFKKMDDDGHDRMLRMYADAWPLSPVSVERQVDDLGQLRNGPREVLSFLCRPATVPPRAVGEDQRPLILRDALQSFVQVLLGQYLCDIYFLCSRKCFPATHLIRSGRHSPIDTVANPQGRRR